MATTEDACWVLRGEAIIGLVRRPRRLVPLPTGLHRLPGPALIVGQRFNDSPAGPFCTLAIGEPARLGARPGYYFGLAVLDNPEARRAGRQYWGYPYELGRLTWSSDAEARSITWEERDITVTAEVLGARWPLLWSSRSLQHRRDGAVIVPSRLRALARRSRIIVETLDSDPLSAIAGPHPGVVLDGLLLRRNPARRPLGTFSTLRAPLRAPEPGIIGMDPMPAARGSHAHQVQSRRPGAYSSAG